MELANLQKGKSAELLVFSELIKKGADLYLPVIDIGIDAIVRREDGTHLDVQVKSTEADEQAGYFNVKASKLHPKVNLFVVCVDMSPLDATPARQPEVWIFPSCTFVKYSTLTSGEYRMALPAGKRKYGKPLKELLIRYREAWELLTGDTTHG